jgi:hypothetical protein
MTKFLKILSAVVLALCTGFGAWFAYREIRVPQNERDALTRAIELEKWHRYDKAAQVLQKWMTDPRRDVSRDGFLYGQIASVYIAKAHKKPSTRDESVHQAKRNLEEELDLFEKQKPTDLQIDLFEIGGSYAILGDLSEKDKCQYYAKAELELKRQLPLIQGDSYTAYGTTIPLDRVRGEIKKHIEAVNTKFSKAGCSSAAND